MRGDRTEFLVDEQGRVVTDATPSADLLGFPAALGIMRLVSALKFVNNPPVVFPAEVVVDPFGRAVTDGTGATLGFASLYIPRMLAATRTINTRGL